MRLRTHVIPPMIMLLVCGCAVRSRYIEKRGVLDDSLYYCEQDSGGTKRAISDDVVDLEGREPSRVPHPALVDIDSLIHILVDKERFSCREDEGLLAGRSEELLKRKKEVHRALIELENVVHVRQKAVEAYYDDDLDKFISAKKAFGRAEKGLLDRLDELWPEGTPEYNELEEAYDPPAFARLQEFLQARIDTLEIEDRIIDDEVNGRITSLRLEAFLSSPDKDPVAVYLDGYNSIKQGEFQRRDRLGLDLSNEERVRLDTQVKATQEIATTAERVRKGEISLQYALRETIPLVSPRLGRLLPEIESLLQKLDKEPLRERLNKMEELLNQFVEEVRRQEEELASQIEEDLEKMPEEFRSSMKQKSESFVEVLFLFKEVKNLRSRWSSAMLADQAALITDSLGMLGRIGGVDLPKLATDMEGNLNRLLEMKFERLELDVRNTILHVAKGEEASKLRAHLEEFYQDLHSVEELKNKVTAVFDVFKVSAVVVGTQVPESLKVPREEVKGTFIDLNYLPRLPGDVIALRATLYEGEEERDTTIASFQVERFGWFAELSPAVVLVKPEKLEGVNDGFRFAPTLSWMHHYVPRPEDSTWYAPILRGLQPAVGIHSIFMNFDSEVSAGALQVGLGATVSFWKNRLQFGAGYNLMAVSDEKSRYYYFVGTDLIGLLQTVGVGK